MYRNKRKILLVVLLSLFFVGNAQAQEARISGIKAVAFDAFPIFDPRPIASLAEELFPEHGQALMELWLTRIFEYQWLRVLGGEYEDFMHTAETGLRFATTRMNLLLTPDKQDKLLSAFENLEVWPDAPAAIRELKAKGLKLVFLSNMTSEMLDNGVASAGLKDSFSHIISTDAIRSYKPAPEAYNLAVETLSLQKEEILFVAFAGWDVAGAKWFGFPTFWVNRLGTPIEELGVTPDGSSRDLSGLLEFVSN